MKMLVDKETWDAEREVVAAAKEYAAFMRDPVGKNLMDLHPLQVRLIEAVAALELLA